MKKHNFFLAILLTVALIPACTTDYNEREIVGRWFSTQWLSDGAETDFTAWFDFSEDMTYRAVINRNQEQGKYWIEGYKLYTHAQGSEPIVVKIEKLEGEHMELSMNRAGQAEQLFLVRSK